jgi:hypothetical protein
MIFARRHHLPLGVDIEAHEVSLVAVEMRAGRLVVKVAESRSLPPSGDAERDQAIVETLRAMRADLALGERRCVISAPLGETQTRTFLPPPGMRPAEAERAAMLEAETFVSWPARERLVALDPIPGADEYLLSVARGAAVERSARLMKLAGLEPVAVDVPACVWRRVVTEADAVLDLRQERAALFVFGNPLGLIERFPQGSDDQLLAQIRALLIQARRDGVADVERIVTAGSRERANSIESSLADDGYDAGPLTLGEAIAPPWSFAYGLASWAVLLRERPAA